MLLACSAQPSFPAGVGLAFGSCPKKFPALRPMQASSPNSVAPKRLHASEDLGIDIVYQHEHEIGYEEISELLEKVDWPPRRQSRLQTALENSFFLATLRACKSPQDMQLVGLARVVSDGAFNAQVWDVIIDPAFQEKGLGRQLVEEIVRYLIERDITNITTFAEKNGTKFYEKLGFQSDPEGVRGMFWRQMQ